MTAEEYNDNLTNLYGLVSGDLASDTIAVAGRKLLTNVKERILSGKNTEDGEIGKYSTKPLYASAKSFVAGGFNPQGKNVIKSKGKYKGQTIGDVRISHYLYRDSLTVPKKLRAEYIRKRFDFQKNYKRFKLVKSSGAERKSMYLAQGYKQLRDVQSLQSAHVDFSYSGSLLADYVQEQQDNQTVVQGFTEDLQSKKRHGLEGRFGTTFYPTEDEKKQYIDDVTFLLKRLTINTMEGIYVEATIT